MRQCTLVFLVKKDGESRVCEVCLGRKKKGFGAGKWNGAGGKVEHGESIETGAAREAREEFGVHVGELSHVGELTFHFAYEPSWDQVVNVFVCSEWDGEPCESEEMAPQWFPMEALPYDTMWIDDSHWLPHVLDGKRVRATFTFGKDDSLLEKHVTLVDSLV